MDRDLIQNATRIIKLQYTDAKVLLFGSTAREKDAEESDIDLCIVIEDPKERLLDISRNIRKAIYPVLHKPLDILVYDKKSFDERSSLPLSMEAEIIEHGVEI